MGIQNFLSIKKLNYIFTEDQIALQSTMCVQIKCQCMYSNQDKGTKYFVLPPFRKKVPL